MSYKKVFLVLGLLLVMSHSVSAGGLEGPGVGTRPLSMGGAFIGLADDWTSIYWNPAGLARLSGKGGGLSLDYVPSKASDGNSAGNPILPLSQEAKDRGEVFFQFGGEPDNFDKKDIESTVYLPTLGGYTQFKGFVVSGGIYVPLGYATEWKDSKDTVDASFEMKAYEIVYNISAARKVRENLFLGLGLNILQGSSKMEAEKVTTSYTYTSKAEADGFGLEGVMGALYQIRPDLSAGLIYRTGAELTLDGEARITHPILLPPAGEESNYEQKFRIPTTYGLGLAYQPTSKLTLTCDWNYTDWTTFKKEIDFDTQDQTFLKDTPDEEKDLDWKAVDKIRLGLEYKPNNIWSFRAGFFTDPSPVPDKALNMTNLAGIDTDRNFWTVGSTYNYKNWHFNLGFIHTKSDREALGVEYKKEANSIHLATSRRF